MGGASVQLKFGKAVQSARLGLGYSQEAFAAVLGMHRTQLGHIEQGLKDCRLSTIVRISAALGMSASQLLDQVDAKRAR
ncbi:helix-turn-helix domain-containing protein [Pseudoxanthomonas sp. UTMC 1351]|uniref:helix-turn-helix domain-containing protein n=1 Tax=Pseudoxanthomonas sp. UTMC 1351 TaxID=2695853 RepID=UPI0034CEF410